MTEHESLEEELYSTLEKHEREVKQAVETLGAVERQLHDFATSTKADGDMHRILKQLGQTLERHENQVENVVQTLDEHKRMIYQTDDLSREALENAIEKARRQARHESRPTSEQSPTNESPES